VTDSTRSLLLRFVGLEIAMALGALICLLVGSVVRASTIDTTAYRPGTLLYFLGDVVFLTVPVVAWMLWRYRGLRHSFELAVAMLTPVAAIIVVGELTRSSYLVWLLTAMYPAMSVGMLAYLLRRGEAFVPASSPVPSGNGFERSEEQPAL
jgi:hypothetical protein